MKKKFDEIQNEIRKERLATLDYIRETPCSSQEELLASHIEKGKHRGGNATDPLSGFMYNDRQVFEYAVQAGAIKERSRSLRASVRYFCEVQHRTITRQTALAFWTRIYTEEMICDILQEHEQMSTADLIEEIVFQDMKEFDARDALEHLLSRGTVTLGPNLHVQLTPSYKEADWHLEPKEMKF